MNDSFHSSEPSVEKRLVKLTPPPLPIMCLLLRFLLCGACLTFASIHAADAQNEVEPPAVEEAQPDPYQKLIGSIQWKTEGTGDVGSMATLRIPSGYRFTGDTGTVRLMEAFGNLTNGNELALISPMDTKQWFAVFEFEDSGYVKDDDKDKLDPDKILETLKEGQLAANERLASQGMSTMTVLGWQTPPFYNPKTHNLEWAIRLKSSDGGQNINYKTKLLGRRGVMDVVLVCSEEQLATVIPEYQKLMTGFAFKKEDSYASYQKGDKIAEYGLTGLIVGGGLLAAAKFGFLAKFGKFIAAGVVAFAAFFKRIFRGKTRESI